MKDARSIIRELGGPSKVAAVVGVHRTRVSNWMRPKKAGGTGGIIPLAHHRALLEAAQKAGKPLTADDLLPPSVDPAPEQVAADTREVA